METDDRQTERERERQRQRDTERDGQTDTDRFIGEEGLEKTDGL